MNCKNCDNKLKNKKSHYRVIEVLGKNYYWVYSNANKFFVRGLGSPDFNWIEDNCVYSHADWENQKDTEAHLSPRDVAKFIKYKMEERKEK